MIFYNYCVCYDGKAVPVNFNHIMKPPNICPLCKSTSPAKFFTSWNRHGRHDINKKDRFTVMRCLRCDVVYLPGIKTDNNYYKKYYDTGYYDGGLNTDGGILHKAVALLEKWSGKQKEKILLSYAPKRETKLKILDVGCGSGKFLGSLNSTKFEKFGIEINEEGIQLSRQKGLTVYDKDITKIDFKGTKFDIITLWHVAEHLINPIAVFSKIHSILADDGIVLNATPNTGSLGFRFGNSKWFHLDSPRHLMLFNNKSMLYLCDKTKLQLKAGINEFYDYPLDLFWSVKDNNYKFLLYPIYPIAKMFDAEALTQIFTKI